MIKVQFTQNNGEIRLSVAGHAGFAEHGKDIVCASASILTYTLVSIIQRAFVDGKLEKAPYVVTNEGFGYVCAKPKQEWYKNVRRAFYFALEGYTLLSEQYPDNVGITRDCADDTESST